MAFKNPKKIFFHGIIYFLVTVIITSCSQGGKENNANTYYIELVNFSDTLKKPLNFRISGKVSYNKNGRPEMMSRNYVTEEHPDMYYFEVLENNNSPFKNGSQKIRIEFSGKYTIDSINYSIQKYRYGKEGWQKIADMGFIKGYTTFLQSPRIAINEYGDQIINNMLYVAYH